MINGNGLGSISKIIDGALRLGVPAVIALYLVWVISTTVTSQYQEIRVRLDEARTAQIELSRNQLDTIRAIERLNTRIDAR